MIKRSSVEQDLTLEAKIALELGRMVIRFAALESVTRLLLEQRLDLPEPQTDLITNGLPFRKVREVVLALYHDEYGEGEKLTRLKELMDRAGRLEERRNELMHSRWIHSKLPQVLGRRKSKITGRGIFKVDLEHFVSDKTLQLLTDEMCKLAEDISSFIVNYM